jgi:hypothetical protein
VSLPAPEPDPALIAAESGAASALLGAAATGPLTAPIDGVPLVAGPPAGARSGRYAGIEVARITLPDGRVVAYHRRRFIPQPEALATQGWEQVDDGDRVDHLAARALGDPTAFWRLCDANLADDPAELEQPGRTLRVALPEGFPGA